MNDELRLELLEMVRIDQELRNAVIKDIGNRELVAKIEETDISHTERLREIVAAHGWPGASLVSTDGAHAAWLLVQHADRSPDFQETCLQLMMEADTAEVEMKNVAYLTDRVRVNTGRLQVYGTQFWNDERGEFGPRPMEDRQRVDERRVSMGLGLFEEYLQQMLALHAESELNRSAR